MMNTHTVPLTLRLLQEVLAAVEDREGLINARRLAAALDYDRLTELAHRGATGEAENDPALIDPRYLVLWGMHGEPVVQLQDALVSLGFAAPRTGRYCDATYAVYRTWLVHVGRATPLPSEPRLRPLPRPARVAESWIDPRGCWADPTRPTA